jgi:hypothetical protein
MKQTPDLDKTTWCSQRDWVPDNKWHRCSKCGRRLRANMINCVGGEFVGWKLPMHKIRK